MVEEDRLWMKYSEPVRGCDVFEVLNLCSRAATRSPLRYAEILP